MRAYVFVSASFEAFHTDPIMREGRHSHVWTVRAYFQAKPFRDARSLKASLELILSSWRGADLPASLWATENLAAAILQLHGNADCVGVEIDREDGCGAQAWRE